MIIIVGAGLAGLACATRLQQAGRDYILLESKLVPGGRVATEITEEGYKLDTGFQVLLDSYPTARKLLNYEALQPRYFQSGALLADEKSGWERLLNPIAHPEGLLPALTSRTFSWSEKVSLGIHALIQLLRSDAALLGKETGHSTLEELHRLGLDGAILERFLRPFFAGVFLDNNLGTEASVFRYDLKKFALGKALLPAGGMGKIPEQLADHLPGNRQRYGARVMALRREGERITGVELEGGEFLECSELVLATDEGTTRGLLGLPPGEEWIGVTTLYFIGEEPLYEGALLVLPHWPEGSRRVVRHFTDLTNIAPEYAPHGKRLLSATVLNSPSENALELAELAQAEIVALLPAFASWKFLKEVRIRLALPKRRPGYGKGLLPLSVAPNLFLAGDQISPAGIESALASGVRAAEALLGRA